MKILKSCLLFIFSIPRIVWVVLIVAIIAVPIFYGVWFLNQHDTNVSLSSQVISVAPENFTRYKVAVRSSLDLSQNPSILIGHNVTFLFNFTKIVHVADQDGNYLGDVGPGKSLDLGNVPKLKGMYFYSEDGPWEDEMFLCTKDCSN